VSTRPLERLPTIRAKLGSTIVFAVGMTVLLIFFMLGFALRDSSRATDTLHLLAIARKSASGASGPMPRDVTLVRSTPLGAITSGRPPVPLPSISDDQTHVGTTNGSDYAVAPVVVSGTVTELVWVFRPAPSKSLFEPIEATFRFLGRFWWQFLLAGALAAGIALVMARWLARGMTQPLRDMAQAAHRMETGDYGVRVHTKSRDEEG